MLSNNVLLFARLKVDWISKTSHATLCTMSTMPNVHSLWLFSTTSFDGLAALLRRIPRPALRLDIVPISSIEPLLCHATVPPVTFLSVPSNTASQHMMGSSLRTSADQDFLMETTGTGSTYSIPATVPCINLFLCPISSKTGSFRPIS